MTQVVISTLPIFRIRKIDLHVRKCGKLRGKSISKTSVRGRLFRDERFLSSDSVYNTFNLLYFFVKDAKQVWRKNYKMFEFNYVRRQLWCSYKATCSWLTGKSGYCNHVMSLLYEIAEYSLNQITEVPQEKACASALRKWRVRWNKEVVKEIVMSTTLISSDQKKGISPTLYDAIDWEKKV